MRACWATARARNELHAGCQMVQLRVFETLLNSGAHLLVLDVNHQLHWNHPFQALMMPPAPACSFRQPARDALSSEPEVRDLLEGDFSKNTQLSSDSCMSNA